LEKGIRVSQPGRITSDLMTLEEAADWLRVKKKTLQNWVYEGLFTVIDGLRKIGGEYKIHFPTMQKRVAEGNFMGLSLAPAKSTLGERRTQRSPKKKLARNVGVGLGQTDQNCVGK
jgi:Helix-turn-helix domain